MHRRWLSHRRPVEFSVASRRGLTLIEILIALVMTLIVLGAMITAFQYASAEITKGRARIEMTNQLRVVLDLLRADLDGLTVDVRPWAKTSAPPGYFEYIEGPLSDRSSQRLTPPVDNVLGDTDDILALTTRAEGKPFRGRYNGGVIESNVAEVIWWTNVDVVNIGEPSYTDSVRIYRRVLLIRPDLPPVPVADIADVRRFFLTNDVSMRWDPASNLLIPNALGDLGRREHRFAHPPLIVNGTLSPNYPHLMDRQFLRDVQMTEVNMVAHGLTGPELQYIGQDIVLNNVMAFDLKAFSVNTAVLNDGGIIIQPSDLHYPASSLQPTDPRIVDYGAYVDLGYAFQVLPPDLLTLPPPPGPLSRPGFDSSYPDFAGRPTYSWIDACQNAGYPLYEIFVYDTFTTAYESDGLDQDGNGIVDQAIDGLDNDGINGVDDEGERETAAP
ncbi:MAG TPA: hypothetical protein PKD54_14430, partial [Pirellulaceae bacterium]|nr:hypothetical protein [Pirellulaceae bacterium]